MNIPTFSAQASIYSPQASYRTTGSAAQDGVRSVLGQLVPLTSCISYCDVDGNCNNLYCANGEPRQGWGGGWNIGPLGGPALPAVCRARCRFEPPDEREACLAKC
jgi:hypothetical protein